ncbi:MAG: hypothetical protein QOF44_695 [Streptomyces sp.]|jgi:hypothetical protein|nr:hypothetical protein [Streptomyces sp.]
MSRRRPARPEPWEDASDPALAYATHHLGWYRRTRDRARFQTKAGDFLMLLSTAATVVVSALHAPAPVTASLAGLALFLTGYRQVFRPNDRWVSTGVAWMALQHAVARYYVTPEAERTPEMREALMDRTLEIVSAENQAWAEQRRGLGPTVPVQQTQ